MKNELNSNNQLRVVTGIDPEDCARSTICCTTLARALFVGAREATVIFAWVSLTIGQLAALVRLIWLGRRYRWFAGYVGVDLLRAVVLLCLKGGSSPRTWHSYYLTWLCSEPLALFLLAGSAFEIVRRVPEHYRGFGDFGQKKLRGLLQLALTMAVFSSIFEARSYPWSFSVLTCLPLLITAQRMITSALAGYLVLTALWLSHLRIPMQPNLFRHSLLFAIYLLFDAAVMLSYMIYGNGHGTALSDMVLTLGSNFLFLLWAVLLTKKGEQFPQYRSLQPDESDDLREREEQLLTLIQNARRQLDGPD